MQSMLGDMKITRFWMTGLMFVGLGLMIAKAFDMIILVISAMVISIFIEAIAEYFIKWGVPRFVAIIGVFVLVLLMFAGLIVSTIPVIIKEIAALKPFLPDGDQLEKILKTLGTSGGKEQVDSFLAISPDVVQKLTSSTKDIGQTAFRLVTSTLGGFANMVLLSMLSLYLALEHKAVERLIRAVAPEKNEAYILSLWHRVRGKTEGWFRGQLVIALIVMVFTYAGLLIIGVEYALLLALLAGVLGIIPFGVVVAFLPALGIAFAHGTVLTPVYVTILYGFLQYTTDYIVQPILTKRSTGLPPLLVIISMVISLTLFGILGFLIAIPTALFFLEVTNDIENAKKGAKAKRDEKREQEEVVPLEEGQELEIIE
jgi:predicted PurR-regulated permease PerM